MKQTLTILLLFLSLASSAQRIITIGGGSGGSTGPQGPTGPSGITPTFVIGTVSSLTPTASPTVTLTGTPPAYVLNFGIPSGTGSTTTPPSSTTTAPPSTTSSPAMSGTFVQADSTLGRVNYATMTDINIPDNATLNTYLGQTVTNKRLILADGDYTGLHSQIGAWTNVELTSLTGNARLVSTSNATALIFNNSPLRNRISIKRLKFVCTKNDGSGDNPMVWWTELPVIDGMEISYCDFTVPGLVANALGCVQYSTSSNSGNIAKNVFVHHNNFHDIGRMGIEFLSQGYDTPRLFNVTITNNTFSNLGLRDQYGMALSLSGLIRQIRVSNNNATNTKKVAYEYVNVQDVNSDNNNCTSLTQGSVGYGISDDAQNTTRSIYITGGNFNMSERPFYVYGSSDVHIFGGTYIGRRGVDMVCYNSSFRNITVYIWTREFDTSWQITQGTNVLFDNLFISSANSVGNGGRYAFETLYLRTNTSNCTASNCTTITGKMEDGTYFSDGHIFNTGTNNTVTNNIFSQAPN